MIIKIDYREKQLIPLCLFLSEKYNNITIIQENLPLADIIILDDNNKELVLIERKSLNDLSCSIKDGRYKEQSFRLNECEIYNHNIIYLIEGNLTTFKSKNKLSNSTLLSSMISMNLLKGFSIFRTLNINESAEYIILMADKLHREKQNNKNLFYNNQIINNNISNNKNINNTNNINNINNENIDNINVNCEENEIIENYTSVLKKSKKSHITTDNISEIMLSQIPSVSSNIANIIMKKYKSINLLIFELKQNPKCLESLMIKDKNNNERKISKTACSNIYKYLNI